MSRLLNLSPFSDEILKLTEAQIDWIFNMHNLNADENHKIKFVSVDAAPEVLAQKRWTDVLIGRGLNEYLGERVPAYRRMKVRG